MNTEVETAALATAQKIAAAITAKLPDWPGDVKLIKLPEFTYVEFAFRRKNSVEVMTVGYNVQIFTSVATDLNAKAKKVFLDVKAVLGLE